MSFAQSKPGSLKGLIYMTIVPHGAAPQPLIVHSHLRWNFVWQRPQQIMSRMATDRDVLFIEDPELLDQHATPYLHLEDVAPRITRAVPRLVEAWSREDDVRQRATAGLIRESTGPRGRLAGRFRDPVHWFYTPMPAPAMLHHDEHSIVAYDCMDQLSQFRFAPPELQAREEFLLARADVVFTGGYQLAESKRGSRLEVHCVPCGVDYRHFASAADFPRHLVDPTVGYMGVIDERLDYGLIARLAESCPDLRIEMVGPRVKVADAELPKHPNIHWVGQVDYRRLPEVLAQWDVCLMPFALNEATEFINPTKTLEYLASGRPIVSTAVPDVVAAFEGVVPIAGSADEFVSLVLAQLAAPSADLIELGRARASASSWDSAVGIMKAHLALVRNSRAANGAIRVAQSAS